MAECSKKNTCINYPAKCVDCGANSDIYNHYPCYKDVDEVEVVRCSQCVKRNTTNCALWFSQLDDKQYFCGAMHNDDFYCSYGERKDDNG